MNFKHCMHKLSAVFVLLLIVSGTAQAQDASQAELTFWNSVGSSGDPEMIQAYIEAYPEGHFLLLAKVLLKKSLKTQLVSAQAECDQLAADPDDPNRTVPGVPAKTLKNQANAAIEACLIASKTGDPRFLHQLAYAYFVTGDTVQGIVNLKQAADQEYPVSEYSLAGLMALGTSGVERDIDQAKKLLLKSAQGGISKAWWKLGVIAVKQGTSAIAKGHFEKAAEEGVAQAYYDLAVLLAEKYDAASLRKRKDLLRKSVAATDFRRIEAKSELSHILWDEYKAARYKLTSKRVTIGWLKLYEDTKELETLFSDTRDFNSRQMKEYVQLFGFRYFHLASSIAKTAYPNSQERALLVRLNKLADSDLDKFFTALAEQAEKNPNGFGHHEDSFLRAERKWLTKAFSDELPRYWRSRRALDLYKNQTIYDCVKSEGDWDGDKYVIKSKNNCGIPVELRVRVGLRKVKGGKYYRYDSQVDHLKPGQSSEVFRGDGSKQEIWGTFDRAICPDGMTFPADFRHSDGISLVTTKCEGGQITQQNVNADILRRVTALTKAR